MLIHQISNRYDRSTMLSLSFPRVQSAVTCTLALLVVLFRLRMILNPPFPLPPSYITMKLIHLATLFTTLTTAEALGETPFESKVTLDDQAFPPNSNYRSRRTKHNDGDDRSNLGLGALFAVSYDESRQKCTFSWRSDGDDHTPFQSIEVDDTVKFSHGGNVVTCRENEEPSDEFLSAFDSNITPEGIFKNDFAFDAFSWSGSKAIYAKVEWDIKDKNLEVIIEKEPEVIIEKEPEITTKSTKSSKGTKAGGT